MVGISIDFLPVGEGAKNGDSITIAYGSDFDKKIMVVDGGSRDAGKKAIAHIHRHYGDHVTIEHMVCTHQDSDHSSGLRELVCAFPVRNLWIHQPWLYAEQLVSAFKYRWTAEGLRRHLRNEAFPIVADLCNLAEERGVVLREPFQGVSIGPFMCLAPNKERWLGLLPTMDQTPAMRTQQESSIFEKAFVALEAAALRIVEGWGYETLRNPAWDATSATNESSVVLHGIFDGGGVLLTADAGVGALEDALSGAEAMGRAIQQPALIQIPHHGSRRNVGPDVLDRLLGTQVTQGTKRGGAISSVSSGCDIMPRRMVENAFTRRGYDCVPTKGRTLNMTLGMLPRGGFEPVSPSPFHQYVED